MGFLKPQRDKSHIVCHNFHFFQKYTIYKNYFFCYYKIRGDKLQIVKVLL